MTGDVFNIQQSKTWTISADASGDEEPKRYTEGRGKHQLAIEVADNLQY